jgi:hypothetical protein
MATKIIPLTRQTIGNTQPNYKPTESELLLNGAWQFAYALLWQHQPFSKFEIARSKALISKYLKQAPDGYNAFQHFCERVALAERYISAGILTPPPMPSIYLNPHYEHGISETLALITDLHQKRGNVPGYMDQIFITADYYCRYVLQPSAKTFLRCRRRLISLGAYGMLQHFYNATLQAHYLKN